MNRVTVGHICHARDYKEPVMAIKVEVDQGEHSRLLVERLNGERTHNYPLYLLEPCTQEHMDAAEDLRQQHRKDTP